MVERSELLGDYVQELIHQGAIRSAPVERAFRAVERDRFLRSIYRYLPQEGTWECITHSPENPDLKTLQLIYSDRSLVTLVRDGRPVSSTSQPSLVAQMLEALELYPGAKVLEIGTGTGYNAALMAKIVGDHGCIVTLDIRAEVANQAHQLLSQMGYTNIRVLCRDGFYGASEYGPYDRIVATVGCTDISPHWVQQLAPQGFMLVPLQHGSLSSHPLVHIHLEEGRLVGRVVGWSGFMIIEGELAWAGEFWAESPWITRVPPFVLQGEPVASYPLPPELPLADDPLKNPIHQAFYFLLTLNDRRACETLRGYGLITPESAVVISGQQVLLYSQDTQPDKELYETMMTLYHTWQDLGRPSWRDYMLQFSPTSSAKGQLYKQDHKWIITRKWFEQLTWLHENALWK